jgi:hypothetical protein
MKIEYLDVEFIAEQSGGGSNQFVHRDYRYAHVRHQHDRQRCPGFDQFSMLFFVKTSSADHNWGLLADCNRQQRHRCRRRTVVDDDIDPTTKRASIVSDSKSERGQPASVPRSSPIFGESDLSQPPPSVQMLLSVIALISMVPIWPAAPHSPILVIFNGLQFIALIGSPELIPKPDIARPPRSGNPWTTLSWLPLSGAGIEA